MKIPLDSKSAFFIQWNRGKQFLNELIFRGFTWRFWKVAKEEAQQLHAWRCRERVSISMQAALIPELEWTSRGPWPHPSTSIIERSVKCLRLRLLKRINVLNRNKLWLAFNLLFLSIKRCVGILWEFVKNHLPFHCWWWLCDMAFYGLLLPFRHFSRSPTSFDTTRRWTRTRMFADADFFFPTNTFSSDDSSRLWLWLWHSQESQDTIASSNVVDLSFFLFYDGIYFRAWDNIWGFNGATYFMKSTNKYFVTSSASIIKTRTFYWIFDHK